MVSMQKLILWLFLEITVEIVGSPSTCLKLNPYPPLLLHQISLRNMPPTLIPTKYKSPTSNLMATFFCIGLSQSGGTFGIKVRLDSWQDKRRPQQKRTQVMLLGILKTPWSWHGQWIPWKDKLAPTTCVTQEPKNSGIISPNLF